MKYIFLLVKIYLSVFVDTQIACMRWPNVGLWLVEWLMVGVGFVTLGQRRCRRATLHWANADCQSRPNVATDAVPTQCQRWPTLDQRIHLGPWPNEGPMSKITLGQRLFYDVGPTCTYYHGPTLAQHSHAIWVYPCFHLGRFHVARWKIL